MSTTAFHRPAAVVLRILPVLLVMLAADGGSVADDTCVAPPTDLVGWWPGDDHPDDISGANPGMLLSGTDFGPGYVEDAFHLDGVDDAVEIHEASANLDGFVQLTIDAWIFPTSVAGTRAIVTKYDSTTNGVSYYFAIENGVLRLLIYQQIWSVEPGPLNCNSAVEDLRVAIIESGGGAIQENVWTHVAGVWSGGSNLQLYRNGGQVPSTVTVVGAFQSMSNNQTPVSIGRIAKVTCTNHGQPAGFFTGRIDEVEIFNRALSASEVQLIFNAGSAGKCKVPVADAGPDDTVDEGSAVTLSGSGQDPLGKALAFSWTQVGGPAVTLSDSSIAGPGFTAPSVPAGGATLTFQLVVSSSVGSSEPDFVNVIVKNVNHAPAAETTGDLTAPEGAMVTLDGSPSFDLDDEPLTYAWTQTAGTLVALSGDTTATPTFTAPAVGSAGETLTFRLVVNDGIEDSVPAFVNVFVTNVNQMPTADAGEDISANENTTVVLSGSGTDPDDDALTFTWTQTGGGLVVLSDTTSPTPNFSAPIVAPGGEVFTFQLVVSDGQLDSGADDVVVHVLNVNDPPSCALAAASPGLLWPPNHKLVPVSIGGVIDPQGDAITIAVTAVTQDEPTSGLGDGDTSPDAVIQGDAVLLRAERWDQGNGRVYAMSFTATDGLESCSGTIIVTAPKNMKKGNSAVDDGPIYDSSQP